MDDWFASSGDEEVGGGRLDRRRRCKRRGAPRQRCRGHGCDARARPRPGSCPRYRTTAGSGGRRPSRRSCSSRPRATPCWCWHQGVGKNVAVDRYLSLCGAEREYSQLHRDSTVSSLTATPTLEDGILRHEDAPLVRAALHGRVCVLDEADKAPTEVTVLLKALVADGVLPLPDGRILRVGDNVHADFRLVVLANRPGYPFHGNALFASAATPAGLVVDNPDVDSEVACSRTWRRRGPTMSERLACAFAELVAVRDGSLAYLLDARVRRRRAPP